MQPVAMLTLLVINMAKEKVQLLLDCKMLLFWYHWENDHALLDLLLLGFVFFIFQALIRFCLNCTGVLMNPEVLFWLWHPVVQKVRTF